MSWVKEVPEAPSVPDPRQEIAAPRRKGWRLVGLVVLSLLVFAWLMVHVVAMFIPLDPKLTLLSFNPNFSLHYPLLVVHAFSGTIALVTACMQLSSWLRRRHPAVHRVSGRLYAFAGVFPCTLALVALLPLRASVDGPQSIQTVMYLTSTLWFVTTVAGLRAAWRRDYAGHRRWMVYSVAMAMGILWPGLVIGLLFGKVDFLLLRDIMAWVPWVGTLAFAWWSLRRTRVVAAPAAVAERPPIKQAA